MKCSANTQRSKSARKPKNHGDNKLVIPPNPGTGDMAVATKPRWSNGTAIFFLSILMNS